MSIQHKRSEKLRQRLWLNTARKERPILLAKVNSILSPECQLNLEAFDGLKQFMDEAHQFWGRIQSIKEKEFQTIDDCWSKLDGAFRIPVPNLDAIWFHPESDRLGSIRLKWNLAMKCRAALRKLHWHIMLGSKQHTINSGDFSVMSADGKLGICLEEAEYGYFLRFWTD